MTNALNRKKDPDLVRQKILESTEHLVAENGVTGMSIQAVADMAGVTKGGLFHHFANKQILIEAMLEFILQKLDAQIEQRIMKDSTQYGKFTRAYIDITLDHDENGRSQNWSAFCMTMISDKQYQHHWDHWLEKHLKQYESTDSDIALRILRHAADGLWYIEHFNPSKNNELLQLKAELIRKSYIQ
nr:TetR/AcrR family transcriptional regulator [Acinetobacter sp. Marseille-Q1620]